MSSANIQIESGAFEQLLNIRARATGNRQTEGISDEAVHQFIKSDPSLSVAIKSALTHMHEMIEQDPEFFGSSEVDQIENLQSSFTNFYPDDAICPYVPLGASGPWIVTTKGAIVHDNGGYGMLGFGHAPPAVLEAMNSDHIMANIMTPNMSQRRFTVALGKELGHRHTSGNPYSRYLCLNSGSESVTLAARIADVNAKLLTDEGAKYAGREIRILALDGAFHGRTDRPAQFSDSTRGTYTKHLASFRDNNRLITIPPNDIEALEKVYAQANRDDVFIEAFFIEPVMGEGNPGMATTREFYDRARSLTEIHGSLLLVDSIQAGLRAQGCLSIVDYPGFEDCQAPDMETYSKALNAGQFPLSVLAITTKTAELYRKGIYGNTMTSNPRALDVACAVLGQVNDQLRENIRARGKELLEKLTLLGTELDGAMYKVQGTGLLVSGELDVNKYKSYGHDSTEEYIRKKGINVIHGGINALRFTPHFSITSAEIDLIVDGVRDALINGPSL